MKNISYKFNRFKSFRRLYNFRLWARACSQWAQTIWQEVQFEKTSAFILVLFFLGSKSHGSAPLYEETGSYLFDLGARAQEKSGGSGDEKLFTSPYLESEYVSLQKAALKNAIPLELVAWGLASRQLNGATQDYCEAMWGVKQASAPLVLHKNWQLNCQSPTRSMEHMARYFHLLYRAYGSWPLVTLGLSIPPTEVMNVIFRSKSRDLARILAKHPQGEVVRSRLARMVSVQDTYGGFLMEAPTAPLLTQDFDDFVFPSREEKKARPRRIGAKASTSYRKVDQRHKAKRNSLSIAALNQISKRQKSKIQTKRSSSSRAK